MDKRTILALGIIGVIFVLLPFYWEWIGFSKPAVDVNSQQSSAVADSASVTGSNPGDSARMSSGDLTSTSQSHTIEAATWDTLPEQFTTVETDLYTAKFTSRGATLSSFKLKRFDYLDGDSLVDLVPRRPAYPLQISLSESNGPDLSKLDFVPSASKVELSGAGADSASLTFQGHTPGGGTLTVAYTFRRASYLVGMKVHLGREGDLANANSLELAWNGGLDPTEQNRNDDYSFFSAYVRQGAEVAKFTKFSDGKMHEGSTGAIEWVGTKSKYFLVAMLRTDAAADEFEVSGSQAKVVELGQQVARREFNIQLGNRLREGVDPAFALYLGPVDYHILRDVGHDLDRAAEMGFWLFRPFAIAILWFITFLHQFVPSYGWVIVIFTVVMKTILFPFSRKNYHQMARMKALQPKLKEIQEKYKEDPQELNRRMMKLYKDEKFNPLGGCMWMLPQLPIFWALFTVFKSYIELRGVGFLWLHDLSHANLVLTGVMSAAMLGQQLLTNKDPKQRFMVYGMPALMFFFFRALPSGLVLYWTCYNVLSIVEQWSLQKSTDESTTSAVVVEEPARKSAKK